MVSEIDEVLESKETVSLGDLDKLAYTTAVSMTLIIAPKTIVPYTYARY